MIVDVTASLFLAQQVFPCDHSLEIQIEFLVFERLSVVLASSILEVFVALLQCLICSKQLLLNVFRRLYF